MQLQDMRRKKSLACAICFLTMMPFSVSAQPDQARALVKELVSCHPQLQAARARVKSAEASIDEVEADRLPTFSVSGGGFVTDDGDDDIETSITATLPVLTFGRQDADEKVSQAKLKLSSAEYGKSVSDHVAQLIDLWVRREAANQRIKVYQNSLNTKQRFVGKISRQSAEGVISEADLRDARSEYVADLTEVEDLRLNLLAIETDILALSCDQKTLPFVKWESVPAGPDDVKVQTHPEYRVVTQQVLVAKQEIEEAKKRDNPTVSLQARTSVDNDDRDLNSRIGVAVDYDYKSFGRGLEAAVDQAIFNVREKENLLQNQNIKIQQDIYSNFQRVRQLQEKVIPAMETELRNFNSTLASAQRRYDAGRIPVRDVLSDINSVKQTRLDLVDAREQLQTIYSDLAFTIGLYAE